MGLKKGSRALAPIAHAKSKVEQGPAGRRRFLGLPRECLTLHQQGRPEPVACHPTEEAISVISHQPSADAVALIR